MKQVKVLNLTDVAVTADVRANSLFMRTHYGGQLTFISHL